ncbi:hypothetical protein C349_02474 [Cryptococcus neoformans var. grubii Br795]|nr:hypothetical protein C349_02474 [Cryptococcus neoformans var. grubii Br795]
MLILPECQPNAVRHTCAYNILGGLALPECVLLFLPGFLGGWSQQEKGSKGACVFDGLGEQPGSDGSEFGRVWANAMGRDHMTQKFDLVAKKFRLSGG